MDVKLYVGNLPFATTEDDLRTLFAQAGNVAAVDVVRDRDSGQSRGFAFVTMSTQGDARKAISMFNAFSMNDRELKVSVANPREDRGGYVSRYGAFGSSGSGGPRPHRPRGGSRRH